MSATIDIDDIEEAVEFVEVWEQVMKAERVNLQEIRAHGCIKLQVP